MDSWTDSNVKVAIDKGKTLNSAARIENVTLEITGSNLTKAIELGDEALNVTLSKVNIEIAQGASFRDTGRLFYFGIGNGGKAEFELDNVNIDKSLTDAIPNVFETKSADGQLKTVTVNNSVISGEMIGTFNRFGNGFKFVSNNSTLNVGLGNAFLVSNSLLENNTASFDFNNTVFTKVAIQYTVSSFNGGIVRFEKNEGTDATLSDFSNVSVSFNNSKTIVKDVTNDISINSNLTTVIPSAATKGRYDANLNATGIVGVHQTKDVITDNGYSADSAVYPDVFVNGNQVSFEKLVKAN